MERLAVDEWDTELGAGHVARYRYAAQHIQPDEVINDIACGVGYGATFLAPVGEYHGFDKPTVPDDQFPGFFHEVNLDNIYWKPSAADVTVCFETLEHVRVPTLLARRIADTTSRMIVVSVPTVPTTGFNQWHLHDFTVDDIPPMFPGFTVVDLWHQPEELSHVWRLER